MNVLFVCTENRARSPMAEALFRELQGREVRHQARAVGIAPHAPRRLTTRDLAWADIVAAMEPVHAEVIQAHWPQHAHKVVILDISDHFVPDEQELREALAPKVRTLLEQCEQGPSKPLPRES